jgi:hypothetical protein
MKYLLPQRSMARRTAMRQSSCVQPSLSTDLLSMSPMKVILPRIGG